MPKKKATGMSKREGYLDRNVIAENKAIMRFNEALEKEARRSERVERGDTVDRGDSPDRGPRRERPPASARGTATRPVGGTTTRPTRGRPPRPPAVPAEEEALLRQAASAGADPLGLTDEGARLVDRLVSGDRFEAASSAGWALLVANRPGEPSTAEWDTLREQWEAVRTAVVAEWGKTHPDQVPKPVRKRKPRPTAEEIAAKRREQRLAERAAKRLQAAEAAIEAARAVARAAKSQAAQATRGQDPESLRGAGTRVHADRPLVGVLAGGALSGGLLAGGVLGFAEVTSSPSRDGGRRRRRGGRGRRRTPGSTAGHEVSATPSPQADAPEPTPVPARAADEASP